MSPATIDLERTGLELEDRHGNPIRVCNQTSGQTRGDALLENLVALDVLFEARHDPRFFGVLRGQAGNS